MNVKGSEFSKKANSKWGQNNQWWKRHFNECERNTESDGDRNGFDQRKVEVNQWEEMDRKVKWLG